MTYTADSRIFQQQIEVAVQRAHGRPVWAGVGAYRLDAAGLVEKVELARQTGASGVVLFSNESLEGDHLRTLREQAFGAAVPDQVAPASAAAPGRPLKRN
jgi:hypothetical protein